MTKVTPMANQGSPKWSKGCPKGPKKSPKSAQGEKKCVEGHPKEANKSQNYIHTNKIFAKSPYTAIQRPTSIIYIVYILSGPNNSERVFLELLLDAWI